MIKPSRISQRKLVFLWVCIGFLLFVAFMFFQPLFGGLHMCTMVGCLRSGIEIRFSDNHHPGRFEITLETPDTIQKLKCPDDGGITSTILTSRCYANGAFFRGNSDFPPPEVTVTVFIHGYVISKKFQPNYDTYEVNGPGCAPVCYLATIEFDLSP